jgi:hypothetical protein
MLAYSVGAVLLQEGETNPHTKKPTQHPIAYYSATFTPTECNYDIYEQELLAILKALQQWRPHIVATEIPVIVLTDHANLTFWKNPKTVNRRVARWFTFLQNYNLQIKYVPGKLHAAGQRQTCCLAPQLAIKEKMTIGTSRSFPHTYLSKLLKVN